MGIQRFQKCELFEINRLIQVKKFAEDIINAGRNEILGRAKIRIGTIKTISSRPKKIFWGLSKKSITEYAKPL